MIRLHQKVTKDNAIVLYFLIEGKLYGSTITIKLTHQEKLLEETVITFAQQKFGYTIPIDPTNLGNIVSLQLLHQGKMLYCCPIYIPHHYQVKQLVELIPLKVTLTPDAKMVDIDFDLIDISNHALEYLEKELVS